MVLSFYCYLVIKFNLKRITQYIFNTALIYWICLREGYIKLIRYKSNLIKTVFVLITIGSKKRPCYPLRRPVIESEPLPKVGVKTKPLPSLSRVEPKVVDLISMADRS